MKFISLSCMLLFSAAAAPGQGWSALNDQFLQLYNSEEFDKAAIIGEKAKLAAKKEFGELHVNFATSLYNLAGAYLETGNYKKAEPLYVQAKIIQQKILGETHVDYASTLSDLATLYVETKQYAKAEPLYLQAKAISEKTIGKADPEYITLVDNLATLYDEMKQYDKAEPLYVEANNFYRSHPGENNAHYEASLNHLGELYDRTGRYADAQTHYWLLADLYKQRVGEVSIGYAKIINRIALIYTSMGEYEKAGPLYFDNAEIRKILYGENHHAYASALNNIASHYIDLGQYDNAMAYFEAARNIAELNPDKSNTDYITYVNNIALLYMQMGKYDIAEPLLVKLAEVKKTIVGENDPSYAISLNNLAVIYYKTGQFEKAIPVYITALTVIKKSIGEQTPEYASSLSNLALSYAAMGQTAKAEPLYLQAKVIREKLKGQQHPDYAALLDNLAMLYSSNGEHARIKALYTQSKNIRKKLFGETHPDYAVSLNNLAYYYMDAGQYDSAEILFIQAKDIMKRTLGEDHPNYGTALNNLSDLYIKTGQFEKAEPGLLRSGKIILQNIQTTFTVLSESEKNNYLKNNNAVFETNSNFLFRYKKALPETIINNFNLQLVLKSASLSDTKNMMQLLLNSPDSTIRNLFSRWMANRNLLAKQYSLPENERRKDLATIESETETQEKELNLLSSEFRHQQTALQVVMTDVQKKLLPDEAAIEFIRFPINTTGTDSIMYAAYVLHKNAAVPDFVPLCEEKQLQQLFDSAGKTPTSMVSSFYRGLDIRNTTPGAGGRELYKLIWEPLLPYLKDVKKIAYAPAGKLYSIAFHALPVDSSTILMDKYQLQQYISTREIAFRDKEKIIKPSSISLFGNARFTMDSLQMVQQKAGQPEKGELSSTVYFPAKKSRGNGVWSDLPGTAAEVNKIKQLFEANKIKTTLFIDKEASEENLKKLNGISPQIVHIATHGFFLPDPSTRKATRVSSANTYILADNPLLRSGLVLAGGNYAWSGKKPIEGIEDGIITAYEISQLNLSNTDIVILSACETALGDVKGTEGVFGLQRAFKMAGVKKMIVSLWQVPDRETAELMINFYTYWINGKPINESFSQAQADMRKKYPPYYWAAFVLVE